MQNKTIERYFFFGLLLATIAFTFFVFKPFWIVLVLGACFSVILRPVYEAFRKIKFPSWLSSLLTVILFIILICGPLFGIGEIIFNQSQNLYHSILSGGGITSLSSMNQAIQKILPTGVSFDLNQRVNDLLYLVYNNVGAIFSTTLFTLLSFLLMLLAIFYFLKDGAEWKQSIMSLSPLSEEDNKKIINRLNTAINGVIKGYLLIAVLQGTFMGIGFTIFGLPNSALWGVMTSIAAMIPTPGTSLIAIPAIIYMFVTGNTAGAIGMTIWFVAQFAIMDNYINPRIVSKKINIPPFLILFAIMGGIGLLGPVGILIGPLSISLLYVLVSIYRTEFQQNVT